MKLKDSILQITFIIGIALTIIVILLPQAQAQEITLYPDAFINFTGNWDGTPGDLNDTNTFNTLNETNGNPGFLAIANFTDVRSEPATYTLFYKTRYNGTVGHANNVHVQYFDCISETWTTFGTTTNFVLETFTTTVDNADIRCSDGNSSIRIIHDTGGTTAHIEEIYLISMEGIVPTDPVIHVHFTSDPPSACSICEITIHWANESLTQNLNFSIDGGSVVEFCTACTDEHLELVGLTNGSHNITIFASTLGNVTKNFIIRDSQYYEVPFGIEDLTQEGTGMQTIIYIFYLTVAFLSGLYAMNRKEPITMFLSALFFVLASVECIGVTALSSGVEFTYIYGNYIYLWGGFSIVAIVLTIFFILDQEGFAPK